MFRPVDYNGNLLDWCLDSPSFFTLKILCFQNNSNCNTSWYCRGGVVCLSTAAVSLPLSTRCFELWVLWFAASSHLNQRKFLPKHFPFLLSCAILNNLSRFVCHMLIHKWKSHTLFHTRLQEKWLFLFRWNSNTSSIKFVVLWEKITNLAI